MLAYPSFFQPDRIDAILGTDVLKYVKLDGLHVGADEEPTIFGWAIMGDYKASPAHREDLDQLLKQLWEVEQVNTSSNDLLTKKKEMPFRSSKSQSNRLQMEDMR